MLLLRWIQSLQFPTFRPYKNPKGRLQEFLTYVLGKGGFEGVRVGQVKDKCIEGIIYVQLSEMEEKYLSFRRVHIQKIVDRL